MKLMCKGTMASGRPLLNTMYTVRLLRNDKIHLIIFTAFAAFLDISALMIVIKLISMEAE